MAEIITAIVQLIFIVLEIIFWTIYAVIYTVLRRFGVGDRLPAPKKRRDVWGRNEEDAPLLPQLIAGALALAIVAGGIASIWIYNRIQNKREETATRLVELNASRLDLNQDPPPAREPGFLAQAIDPWGQPVRVVYRDHLTHRTVEVRSAGRDGKYDTWDDPVDTRRTLRTAGRVAAPAAKAAGAAAIGGAVKLWQYRENKKEEAIEAAKQATP